MNKKLIFLDIDGTLTLPGSNEPPRSALEAIRAARAAGPKVFLCSGRNLDMLSPPAPARLRRRRRQRRRLRVRGRAGALRLPDDRLADRARAAAHAEGVPLALYGHTHRARLESREGLTLLNPGAIGRAARPSYAVLMIEDGSFSAELKTL